MDRHEDTRALLAIATEAFAALGNTHQISPFSARPAGLSVEDAYRGTPLVRQMYEAQGARAVGRKIGFTNRTIWSQYGVYAPIWGHVFDRSVHAARRRRNRQHGHADQGDADRSRGDLDRGAKGIGLDPIGLSLVQGSGLN